MYKTSIRTSKISKISNRKTKFIDPIKDLSIQLKKELAYSRVLAVKAGKQLANQEQLGYDLSARPNSFSTTVIDSFITSSVNTIPAGSNSVVVTSLDKLGTKLIDPINPPSFSFSLGFHPSGRFVGVANQNSPFINIYSFDSNTKTIGAKSANPATLPTAGADGAHSLAFHPNGNWVVLGHAVSPFFLIYAFNPTTGVIGAKSADPAILPTGTGQFVSFSPNGNFIAVASASTPFILVYAFDPITGVIGAKVANPAVLPPDTCYGVAFHPNGNFIALAHRGTSTYFSVYTFNSLTGSIGTRSADPITIPTGFCVGVNFASSGNFLAITSFTAGYLFVYPFNASTGAIGTKIADPSSLPTSGANGVVFTPDDSSMIISELGSGVGGLGLYSFNNITGAIGSKTVDSTAGSAAQGIGMHPSGKFFGLAAGSGLSMYQVLNNTISVGQELTIFDDVNLERKLITSVDYVTKSIGFHALTNSYKAKASICRSSAYINETPSRIGNTMLMRGWQQQLTTDAATIGTKIANPAPLPTGLVWNVAFHPNGNFIAAGITTSPFLSVYPLNSTTGAMGTRIDPTTLPVGAGHGITFHPNGNWIAISHSTSPFLSVYAFNSSTGAIGAKVADPVTLPAGIGYSVTFHPNGNFIALAHDISPYLSVYPFDPTTGAIGAKIANPATLPTGTGWNVIFHPNGNFISIGYQTSPFISVYPFNSSTGAIGAKVANPATLPTAACEAVGFHSNGNFIALAYDTSPYLSVHPFNISTGAIGTKIADPATLPPGEANGVAFQPNGNFITVVHFNGPYLSIYPFNSSTGVIGTKIANPAILPTGNAYGLGLHPNGNFVGIAHNVSPFISIYPFAAAIPASPVRVEDFRYTVTGLSNSIKRLTAFLEYASTSDSNYKIDAYISAVSTGSNEIYIPMTKSAKTVNAIKELRFNSSISKTELVTIRFTITRALFLQFDGIDDYVSAGDKDIFSFTANTFSIEFAINVPFNTGQGFMGKRGGPWEYTVYSDSGSLVFTAWDGPGNNVYSLFVPLSAININQRVHIAWTADGTNSYVYINGVLQAQTTKTALNMTNTTSNMEFGRGGAGDLTRYLTGSINDIRLWNVARTQAQIQASMNSQLIGNESGLVGYWKLTESTGLTAYDSTANVNNGSLLNGVKWNESPPTKIITVPQ